MGPLFEDDRTGIVALLQTVNYAYYAGAIGGGWTGEKRKMAVVIAVIFVEMEVVDRHCRIELVEILQIVVARPTIEIRMAQVQTHSHMTKGR